MVCPRLHFKRINYRKDNFCQIRKTVNLILTKFLYFFNSQNNVIAKSNFLKCCFTCSFQNLILAKSKKYAIFPSRIRKIYRHKNSYFTIHSTSFSCFGGLIVLLFSLYFLLLIIFVFFNVSGNVSVSSLVRFIHTFSVDHPFCNFSSIAAAAAGSCQKYGGTCGCLAFPRQGNENCLFSSCGMTLYTTK